MMADGGMTLYFSAAALLFQLVVLIINIIRCVIFGGAMSIELKLINMITRKCHVQINYGS